MSDSQPFILIHFHPALFFPIFHLESFAWTYHIYLPNLLFQPQEWFQIDLKLYYYTYEHRTQSELIHTKKGLKILSLISWLLKRLIHSQPMSHYRNCKNHVLVFQIPVYKLYKTITYRNTNNPFSLTKKKFFLVDSTKL